MKSLDDLYKEINKKYGEGTARAMDEVDMLVLTLVESFN
jgi:hypothetical protein